MHPSSPRGPGNTAGSDATRGNTSSGAPLQGRGSPEEQKSGITLSEKKPRVERRLSFSDVVEDPMWPQPQLPQLGTAITSTTSSSATPIYTTTTTVATTTTTATSIANITTLPTLIIARPAASREEKNDAQHLTHIAHHTSPEDSFYELDEADTLFGQGQSWNPDEKELAGIIEDRDPEILIEDESAMIWAAAKQPSSEILAQLKKRGIEFHPLDRSTNRGWHGEHCPFLTAIDFGRSANLRWLLENEVRPGPDLMLVLPAMETWVKDVFMRVAVTQDRPDNLRLLLESGVRPGRAFELEMPGMPAWAKEIFREYDYML